MHNNDYIFDCNAANALPMSLEGLNCSSGENAEFQGIVVGYHFLLHPKFLNETTVKQQEKTQRLNLIDNILQCASCIVEIGVITTCITEFHNQFGLCFVFKQCSVLANAAYAQIGFASCLY